MYNIIISGAIMQAENKKLKGMHLKPIVTSTGVIGIDASSFL